MSTTAAPQRSVLDPEPPGLVVRATAVVVALACLCFAVVNIVFEATGYVASGQYADYAAGWIQPVNATP